MPPGVSSDEDAVVSLVQSTVSEERQPDLFGVFEQMDKYHPKEPHWFLPLIGGDLVCRGRGHGSALMQHALARCDRDHLPAYLESTNPRNISLYERHGFRVVGRIQVGEAPPIFPMFRDAP